MKTHLDQQPPDASDAFPTDPAGLSMATGPKPRELADGDVFDLQITPVAKQINGTTVRMLGYNGSIPGHLHGAGRFLVLARDGVTEPNLVWKDTVLVRTGQTVDILFHVTEPGLWMAHCHIAEHMQSGMMFSFIVDRETK